MSQVAGRRRQLVVGALATGAFLVAAAVGYVWGSSAAMLNTTWTLHPVRIEQPWPFDDGELEAVRQQMRAQRPGLPEGADPLAGLDLEALRTEQARTRGGQLAIRLGCLDCHGADLGGREMMNVPPVMTLNAPNITSAALGGEYTVDAFEAIVRHGVRRDGTPSLMPSLDYAGLSDREVSDLFVYVASAPPVQRASGRSGWGPVMRAMYAVGRAPPLHAHRIDHERSHPKAPPPKAVSTTYGAHLARTCVGCHREDYRGGPMADGDPAWPPASNLTPHPEGLQRWTLDAFVTLMRTGQRPDGTAVDPRAMPWGALGQLDDVQLQALYLYLRSRPPLPTGS